MRRGQRTRNFYNQRTYENNRRGYCCEHEERKCGDRCLFECENKHMKLRLSNDSRMKCIHLDIKKRPGD